MHHPQRAESGRPSPSSSADWCAYFRANARSLLAIPWERGAEISDSERRAIVESVLGFQLGESSEGRHLVRCAEEYALRAGDPHYLEAVRLFIREEQRHARDLGRFLTLAGASLLSRTWPDTVFRWLRHRAGLELSIFVLIVAEIIAKVYYAALREATASRVLRRLCDQILGDEVEHVRFQSERLAMLRENRGEWMIRCLNGLHRFLFFGTCLAVWLKHGRAVTAGGFGFRRFWRAAWREMNAALHEMDPSQYSFVPAVEPRKAAVG